MTVYNVFYITASLVIPAIMTIALFWIAFSLHKIAKNVKNKKEK